MKQYMLLFLNLFSLSVFSQIGTTMELEGKMKVGLAGDSTSIFIGHGAGEFYNANARRANILLGNLAGRACVSCAGNILMGHEAGFSLAQGVDNIFIGNQAGMVNHQNHNVFIGNGSGLSNTNGQQNTFLGFFTGLLSSSGSYNTQIGALSGANSLGENNTFLGISSGKNTIGDKNVLLGSYSGQYVEGSNNVCIGFESGPAQGSPANNNKLFIDNKTTNSPLIYGDFKFRDIQINGDLRVANTLSLLGDFSIFSSGDDDAIIESVSQTGSDLFLVSNDLLQIHLDENSDSPNSKFLILNGQNEVVFGVDEFGTTSGSSDRNRKENFQLVNEDILDKIKELPISYWQFKGSPTRHIGPMAQDFQSTFLIGSNNKMIATVDADGVALAAIQQLIYYNEHLEQSIIKLENRLATLERNN